jgi:hypothetical protein
MAGMRSLTTVSSQRSVMARGTHCSGSLLSIGCFKQTFSQATVCLSTVILLLYNTEFCKAMDEMFSSYYVTSSWILDRPLLEMRLNFFVQDTENISYCVQALPYMV